MVSTKMTKVFRNGLVMLKMCWHGFLKLKLGYLTYSVLGGRARSYEIHTAVFWPITERGRFGIGKVQLANCAGRAG